MTNGNHIMTSSYVHMVSSPHVKHCLDFSFVFSAPLRAWTNLFSASGISALECTSQAVLGSSYQRKVPASVPLFLKKWKNPSFALRRKRTRVQAPPWFWICSLGLLAWGTDLKSQKGLYSHPSPKHRGRLIHQKLVQVLWHSIIVHYQCAVGSLTNLGGCKDGLEVVVVCLVDWFAVG
jgi:hypothetical protein